MQRTIIVHSGCALQCRRDYFILLCIELKCNFHVTCAPQVGKTRIGVRARTANPVIREWHIVIAHIFQHIFCHHRFSISVFHIRYHFLLLLLLFECPFESQNNKITIKLAVCTQTMPTVCAVRFGCNANRQQSYPHISFIYIVCIYP